MVGLILAILSKVQLHFDEICAFLARRNNNGSKNMQEKWHLIWEGLELQRMNINRVLG
jgi:hypothetical protein